MKQVNVLMLMLLPFLFSCTKKDGNVSPNPSGSQQVSKLSDEEKNLIGSWVYIQATDTTYSSLEGKYTYTNLTQECMKDDVYTFNTNKTYTKDAGLDTSCGKSHGEYEWSIDQHGFDFGGGPAIITKNKYIKIDDNNFAAQSQTPHAFGWGRRTYFFKRKS